ncbi:DNA-binding protein [Streptomyces jumonjinensis]|uniref:DNA-binding protein n=1 Tax=Streptomyces jumonjinensis TaxID=1945 RepID=UPI0037A55EE5
MTAQAGIPLTTWHRTRHTDFRATVPPLPGSHRPILYDAAQVTAYLTGTPIPTLPDEPHPDDLLTDAEYAAVVGISASTVRDAAPHDPGIARHDRRWRTRAQAEARATRPPGPRGRPPGARDRTPRGPRPDPRTAEVTAELAAAAAGDRPAVTTAEIARRYEVSERTAERIKARAAR